MIGWWIVVDRGTPEELQVLADRKPRRLASWEAGLGGLDWLKILVEQGKAKQLRFDGYPCRWVAAAGDVRPFVLDGPPAHRGPPVIGDDYITPPNWLGIAKVDRDGLAGCEPGEALTIEAWDQS